MGHSSSFLKFLVLASIGLGASVAAVGCGPGGTYQRVLPRGSGGESGPGGQSGADAGATGGSPGTGGLVAGTGGATAGGGGGPSDGGKGGPGGTGTAGTSGSGGKAGGAGGAASGGAAGGGRGGGGVGGGGVGGGSGGTATGGAGGGGKAGTGGTGSGGAATGGGGGGGAGGEKCGTGGTVLSIDFVGGVSSGGAGGVSMTMVMDPTECAGVVRAQRWNAAAGPTSSTGLTPLLLSNGTSTTAKVTWEALGTATSAGIWSAKMMDAPGDTRMMNGYLDPAMGINPMATVTVSGLPTAMGSYDIYVYFLASLLSDGETRTHTLKVVTTASTSFTVSQTGKSPTTFPGYSLATATTGNYVVFRKQTGANFTLTSTAVSGTPMRAPINGLQIVWPAAP